MPAGSASIGKKRASAISSERGGFGSPTIFVDKTDMYFGNDRLPLIREAILRRKASAA